MKIQIIHPVGIDVIWLFGLYGLTEEEAALLIKLTRLWEQTQQTNPWTIRVEGIRNRLIRGLSGVNETRQPLFLFQSLESKAPSNVRLALMGYLLVRLATYPDAPLTVLQPQVSEVEDLHRVVIVRSSPPKVTTRLVSIAQLLSQPQT